MRYQGIDRWWIRVFPEDGASASSRPAQRRVPRPGNPFKGGSIMRSTRSLLTIVIAAVVVMLGLVSGPAGATEDAEPPSTFDPNAEPAEASEDLLRDGNVEGVYDEAGTLEGYFDDDGNYVSVLAFSEDQSLLGHCEWSAAGDYVHTSLNSASGHGYWYSNCSSIFADVKVHLYQYYSDRTWRWKASSGWVSVRAKNHGGGQATAKKACTYSLAVTGWRSWVQVFLYGYQKTTWTPSQNIRCRSN